MENRKRLLILGAGGHGRVVKEIAESCGYDTAFLDDHSPDAIGTINEIDKLHIEFDGCFVAIGNPDVRAELISSIERLECEIPVLIHPAAHVSPSAVIGAGTVVCPHATINANVKIGKACIISINGAVDHDARIGDFCHVNSGAVCMAETFLESKQKLDAGKVLTKQGV